MIGVAPTPEEHHIDPDVHDSPQALPTRRGDWSATRLAVLAVLLIVVTTAVTACGGNGTGAGGAAGASPTPSQIESAQPGDVISWSEADASVGQTLTVEGPVASSGRGRGPGGAALLLNVGLDAPDPSRFVAIVPLAIYRRLSADTRAQLDVGIVRVTGKIIGFRGASAIVVTRPADLRLGQ
jgi:hypothetical protein